MNRSNILYLIGLMILSFSSCDHETDTFDGPFLVDRFGEFMVMEELSISSATVDFAAGETVFFRAQFNKNVDWIIEIVGMESGAIKRIEGFSRELEPANATWSGGTTELPFFRAEMCSVTLTVPEEPSFVNTGSVETLSAKSYANAGSLFVDFETADPGIIQQNFDFKFLPSTGIRSDIPAGEGESFLFLEGANNGVGDPFFIGLYEILATVTGETYIPVPTSVPEELYFNYFVYSDGRPYGTAIVDFVFDANDDGVYNSADDQFINPFGETPLNWVGWRQISFPMSTLGNITQAQIEKLVAARLILISDNNSQPDPAEPVAFGADFMIFTEGGPLEL